MASKLCGTRPFLQCKSDNIHNIRAALPLQPLRLPRQFPTFGSASRTRRNKAVLADQSPVVSSDGARLFQWLQDNGMEQAKVQLQEVTRAGSQRLDTVVAAKDISPGDLILSVPESLVVTLDRVFSDGNVAELLTTGKLSELACLTLYLMYEKKQGKDSFWYEYIKELDRLRGRGQLGAKSPLLWGKGEVERLLAGSPVVEEVHARLAAIEKEYGELDTVWFMAGSLFKSYPYDIPTEAFSLELFKQAFVAVQASVVHLQGVPLSKRFALVPLGPPMLSYSSTCRAMLKYDAQRREVTLVSDSAYREGEPVYAWCGPQPNSRMLINYGLVDERNPHDKLKLTVMIPTADPLFHIKRMKLQPFNMATSQAFHLQRNQGLPPKLLPYLRLAFAGSESDIAQACSTFDDPVKIVSHENEALVLQQLALYIHNRLREYPTSMEQDRETVACPTTGPREGVAARMLLIEKTILHDALAAVPGLSQLQSSPIPAHPPPSIKLV